MCEQCINGLCEDHEREQRDREAGFERGSLIHLLTKIIALPLPSLIIGDPRERAEELQARIINLKLSACGRLQKLVDALPE